MLTRFAKTTLLLALAVGISLLFARCDSVSTSSPGGEDQQQGALFEATNDLESRMTALDDTVSMRTFGLTDGPQSSKSVQNLSFTGVAQIAPPGDTTRASYLSTADGQLHVGYKALGPAFKGGIDILDASDPTDILDVSSLGSDNLDVQEVVYDGDEDALFVAAALNPSSYGGDLQGTPSSLIKVTNLSNPQTKVAGLTGNVGKSVVKAPDGDQEHDVYAVTDQTLLYRFDAALENQATQEVSGAEFRSVATTQSTIFTVDRGASVYSSGVGSAESLSEEQTIASGVGELAIGRMQARSKAVLNGDRLFLALGSEGLAVLDAETGEVLFQKSSPYYTSVSLHTDAPEVSSQPSDLVYASRLDGTIDLFRVGENGIDAGGTDTGLNEFGSLDLGALNPNSSAVAAADASSEVAAANASSKVAGADASNRLDAAASANASSKQVAEQVNYVLAIGCHMYAANSQDGVVVLQIGDGQSCSTDEGNQSPTVNDDTDQTTQGESTTTDVLANDNDPDGLDPSTVKVENGPSDGSASANNNGTITYTPDDGFTGEDSYHYSVKDDEGAKSDNATVTITVNEPGNQPPTANPETDNTNEDEPTTTDVLANDSDPDGDLDLSTVQVVSDPSDGTTTVNNNGTITYTPNSGFTGDGSYKYTVKDDDGAESNEARVTIKINAAPTIDEPDPPSGECFTVAPSGQTTITTNDLSASDPDDDPKDLTFTVTSDPTQGELLLNGSPTSTSVFSQESIEKGNLEYNHTASNDDDSFTFDLKDPGDAGPEDVRCNITVGSGNQAPTASDDSDQTNEDQPTTTDVLANDNDPDGSLDASTVTVQSGPSDGSVSVDGSTGEITYTPDSGFTGSDSYTYTVDDNDGETSNEATVTITVNAAPTVDTPEDPPNAECVAVTAGEQTTITTDNLSASDPDDGPADLTFTVTNGPSQGELLLDGSSTSSFTQQDIEDGNLEYNHTASTADDDSFSFDLKDPDGAGPEDVPCNITVESGNQAPTASDDSDQTNEDQPTTTDVLDNDNDPDGSLDASTVTVQSGPSDGSVSVDGSTGEITYTPDTDFTGDDTYTYTVQDNDGAESNEATVTITVQASTAATKGCEGAIGGGVAFTKDGDLKTAASDGGTVNELLITGPDTPVLALGTGVDVDEDGNVGVAYIQQSEGAEQTVSVVDKNDATPTNYALPVAAKSDKTLIGVGSFGGAPSFFYVGAVGNGDEIYRVNFDDGSSEPLADPENGVDAIIGVADVDGDSDKELIFSDGSQQTRYINPGDPSQASFTKLPEGGAGSNNNIGIGSCLADIDGDGRASVPIVDGSNEIDLVDATGVSKTIVTGNANEEAAKTPLAWADIDNDGDPELIYLENNNSPAELKYIDDIAETENFGPSNFKFVENAGGGTIEADTGTGAVSAQ